MPITISAVLAKEPLTEAEIKNGTALRLARCVRSAEGKFSEGPRSYYWDVLRFQVKEQPSPSKLTCLALWGEGHLPTGIRKVSPTKLATHEVKIDSTSWSVDEYSLLLSTNEHRMLVKCGKDSLIIGGGLQGAAIREYGEIISNASVDENYPTWLQKRREVLSSKPAPSDGPLMSIVTPAYKTPPAFLRKMIDSILSQSYGNWELVIVNASPDDEDMLRVFNEYADPRIKVIETPENLGITGNTNLGLAHCTGDYVSFYDHDDTVEPYALAEYVRRINDSDVKPGLLYCDEDNIDENDVPSLPLLKPDYNEDFLLSNNYIIHWLTVRHDLLKKIELSGKDVEGAQDYDMTFKIAELDQPIVHIPEVLYHWRIHSGSTAGNPAQKSYAQDAGAKAIQDHLNRLGMEGEVARGKAFFTYLTSFKVPSPLPTIDVFCNGTPAVITQDALRAYNDAAGDIDNTRLALFITPDHSLELNDLLTLVQHALRNGVFSISPRVIRADGLFDYANSIVAPDGSITKLLRLLPNQDGGYVGRSERPMDAVVGNPECCLVRMDVAADLGIEHGISDNKSMLDAFVAAWDAGKRNLYMPYATARLSTPRTLLDDENRQRVGFDLLSDLAGRALGDPSSNPAFDPFDPYYKLTK